MMAASDAVFKKEADGAMPRAGRASPKLLARAWGGPERFFRRCQRLATPQGGGGGLEHFELFKHCAPNSVIHTLLAALLLCCSVLTSTGLWAQMGGGPAPGAGSATNGAQGTSPPKAAPTPPPMINRWVDAHGVVHYGDALPTDRPVHAIAVGPLEITSDEQRVRAQSQLEHYRTILQQPGTSPAQTQASSAGGQGTAAAAARDESAGHEGGESCADLWARFNAAAACASRYHVSGGGLRGEMAEHCPVVAQPHCQNP